MIILLGENLKIAILFVLIEMDDPINLYLVVISYQLQGQGLIRIIVVIYLLLLQPCFEIISVAILILGTIRIKKALVLIYIGSNFEISCCR